MYVEQKCELVVFSNLNFGKFWEESQLKVMNSMIINCSESFPGHFFRKKLNFIVHKLIQY